MNLGGKKKSVPSFYSKPQAGFPALFPGAVSFLIDFRILIFANDMAREMLNIDQFFEKGLGAMNKLQKLIISIVLIFMGILSIKFLFCVENVFRFFMLLSGTALITATLVILFSLKKANLKNERR